MLDQNTTTVPGTSGGVILGVVLTNLYAARQEKVKRNTAVIKGIFMSNSPQRLQRSRQHKMVNPNGLPIVYVSRPSKWGNPYHIGADGNREQVLKKYREYLAATPSLVENAKEELKGKNLACWCKPSEDCHADILLEIANEG